MNKLIAGLFLLAVSRLCFADPKPNVDFECTISQFAGQAYVQIGKEFHPGITPTLIDVIPGDLQASCKAGSNLVYNISCAFIAPSTGQVLAASQAQVSVPKQDASGGFVLTLPSFRDGKYEIRCFRTVLDRRNPSPAPRAPVY